MTRYGTPRATLNVVNRTDVISQDSLSDVFAWLGPTKLGTPNQPILIYNEAEFVANFGNDYGDFSLQAIRALRGGVKLLVSRVIKYDTGYIAEITTTSGHIVMAKNIGSSGNHYFADCTSISSTEVLFRVGYATTIGSGGVPISTISNVIGC